MFAGFFCLGAPDDSHHVFLHTWKLSLLAADELDFFDHLPGGGEAAHVSDFLPEFNIEGTIAVLRAAGHARHDHTGPRLIVFI